MNAVMLWKEYRQLRAGWLAVALLGLLIPVSLMATFGHGSGWNAAQDPGLHPLLETALSCLALAYGMVSGAMLLAGEKEEGTLVFLDILTCRRRPVWSLKLVAGLFFTLGESLVLIGVAFGLGFGTWITAFQLTFLGLHGLAWGLFGGAVYANVWAAIVTAIAGIAASWPLALLADSWPLTCAAFGGTALAACTVSRLIFCRDDSLRGLVRSVDLIATAGTTISGRDSPERSDAPAQVEPVKESLPWFAGWRVIAWLAFRQGLGVLIGSAAFAALLGAGIYPAPPLVRFVYWPAASLALGLVCGLATFAPDQRDGRQFLGAQRFPAGRIWTVKVLFWAAALVVLTTVAGLMSLLWLAIAGAEGVSLLPDLAETTGWEGRVIPPVSPHGSDAVLWLALWPLYGFCVGQFCGLLPLRPVMAAILATFLTPLVVALWLPSLLVGELSPWYVVAPAAWLLVCTRWAVRPWLGGRLSSGRQLAELAAMTAIGGVLLAGGLWLRAEEMPDPGEPFDVEAYLAALPSASRNEAGPRILRAAAALYQAERLERVDLSFDPIDPVREWVRVKRNKFRALLLAELFQGEWAREAGVAARLPLGMVQDPRTLSRGDGASFRADECCNLATIFVLRSLQLQEQGDPRGGLTHLETALGLARQLQNYTPWDVFKAGLDSEKAALQGLRRWLEGVGRDRELLQAAQTMLRRHEAARPDPANVLKARYLVERQKRGIRWPSVDWRDTLHRAAYEVPWEWERQRRITRAIFSAELDLLHRADEYPLLHLSEKERLEAMAGQVRLALMTGLQPQKGPGAGLTLRQWDKLIGDSWLYKYGEFISPHIRLMNADAVCALNATQIVVALTRYRADHGRLPGQLEGLVPAYLDRLPTDPYHGRAFGYQLVGGDSPRAEVFSKGKPQLRYVVPVWDKR